MSLADDRRIHNGIDVVGLRAQATAVGFLQLCVELNKSGALDDEALARVKGAIARDLAITAPVGMRKEEFDDWVHRRLDGLFEERLEADDDEGSEAAGDGEAAAHASERLP